MHPYLYTFLPFFILVPPILFPHIIYTHLTVILPFIPHSFSNYRCTKAVPIRFLRRRFYFPWPINLFSLFFIKLVHFPLLLFILPIRHPYPYPYQRRFLPLPQNERSHEKSGKPYKRYPIPFLTTFIAPIPYPLILVGPLKTALFYLLYPSLSYYSYYSIHIPLIFLFLPTFI